MLISLAPVISRELARGDGAGKMEGPNAVLNVITIPPGAQPNQARIVIDGVRGAIFEYVAGGALASSWAATAGTDPYGNAYPAGFSAGSGSVFAGTNFVLNTNGLFFYTGTPALGNLSISIAPAAGTDSHGNVYVAGLTTYLTIAGSTYAVSASLPSGSGLPGFSVTTSTHPAFAPAGFFAESESNFPGPAQAFAAMISGQATNTDVPATVQASSQTQSGVTNGLILLESGLVQATAGPVEVDGTVALPLMQFAGGAQFGVNANGTPKILSGTDGNAYNAGDFVSRVQAANLINTITNQTVVQAAVAAGIAYQIEAVITYTENQAAGAAIFDYSGGALPITQVTGISYFVRSTIEGTRNMNGALVGDQSLTMTGITMTWYLKIEAVFTNSALFSIVARCTVAADTFTIAKGSWLAVYPT